MVTKLVEVKLGENGSTIRIVEGGTGLSLTPGQIQRAQDQSREEGIPLFVFQEYGCPVGAWIAFLQMLNDEFGPEPSRIEIKDTLVNDGVPTLTLVTQVGDAH